MPSAYVEAVLADSPVCYFKLDEDTRWHNCRAGSGMVLRPSGPAVSVPRAGLFPGSAGALKFSGVGDLRLDDPLAGNPYSPISIEAWVTRPDTDTGARIFSRGRDGWGAGWSVFLHGRPDGALMGGIVTVSAGPIGYVATSAVGVLPAAGAACHVVMNYIPGAGIRLYANAALVAAENFGTTILRSSSFAACVAGPVLEDPAGWNGAVDDFAIYTTPLSEARIAAHYAARDDAHADEVPTLMMADLRPRLSRAAPVFTAPIDPFAVRVSGRAIVAHDMQYGGRDSVWGTTSIEGKPSNVPTRARVVLLHQRSKNPVREMWSDAQTGAFAFHGLDAGQEFLAVAEDAAGNFQAVAAQRLAPGAMP